MYALAAWAYKRGVTKLELYNEPDLDNCLQVGNYTAYLEHYMLRALAIRNCYEDLNAGRWHRPGGSCACWALRQAQDACLSPRRRRHQAVALPAGGRLRQHRLLGRRHAVLGRPRRARPAPAVRKRHRN